MYSEGIHSMIDAISQLLLIWGIRTSKKLPDDNRPFGYGKELYFWSFIVSLVIFVLGGCLSFYEGLLAFKKPSFSGSSAGNYVILSLAFVFNLLSLWAALRAFERRKGFFNFWKAIATAKDPTAIIVILGDIGDLLGIAVAATGVFLGSLLHNPYYDGIASMMIGAIMITISAFLVKESKSLLLGETTRKDTMARIKMITEKDFAVTKLKKQFSIYMGPDDVLLQLNVVFNAGLSTRQITNSITRVISAIQKEYPLIRQIFIEPVKK